MDKPFAIFDLDGTLVDSMPFWDRLGLDFLDLHGISGSEAENAVLQTARMTLPRSAVYLRERFSLPITAEAAEAELNAVMSQYYRSSIPAKPGVHAYLERLRHCGVRLCVASATGHTLISDCLKRLGLADCFEFLLSCEDLGAGKESPEIYLQAASRFGAQPAHIAVYEDALYALETAKRAGFYTVAVWDKSAIHQWELMRCMADEAIFDWLRLR